MAKLLSKQDKITKVKVNSEVKNKVNQSAENAKAKRKSPKQTFVSITEAAEINEVTRQAIYVAIKLNKLKARKDNTRWEIDLKDLEEYRKHKYSRARSTYKGQLIYDAAKGFHSISQAAKMLGVPSQKIYYATRSGQMKATRKGTAWVVNTADIAAYKKEYLAKKKSSQRKAS